MKRMLLAFMSMMIALSTLLHAEVPTQESVTKLYVATFNRAPDAAGLNYWVNDAGLQLEQISQSFFDQSETQELYPPETSAYDFVWSVYDNLFNREPDPEGLAYWEEEIQSGRIPKSMFILAVINGAQDTVEYGNDATILENKTIVGLAYADAGLDDVDDATEIMSGVTDDYATVTAALDTLLADGLYFYKGDQLATLPSICDGITCVKNVNGAYAGTTIVTHNTYTLKAIGKDYTISNIVQTDLYDHVLVILSGLTDGQVIHAGETVEFSTQSGLTDGFQTKLRWSFSIDGAPMFMDTIYFSSNGPLVPPLANQDPIVDAGDDKSVQIDQSVTITGSASDSDGSIASYEWKKGTEVLATTASFNYTPMAVGTDTLTLTVMDDDGAIASDSMNVIVSEVPPVIHNVSTTEEFRQALLDAAQNGADDKIILADGVYKTTDDGGGTFTFFDNEAKDLHILGTSQEKTILSGDNQNQVINILPNRYSNTLRLEYMTIKDGNTPEDGAGVRSYYMTKIKYLTVTNNTSTEGDGGGLYLPSYSAYGRNTIEYAQITHNRVEGTYSQGAGISGLFIEIYNSNISYNTNVRGKGGGASDVSFIKNSVISHNTAYQLAAVNEAIQIRNCLISDNNSTDTSDTNYFDAVVALNLGNNQHIVNSLMVNNSGGVYGGRFIVNSLFIDNKNMDITGESTSTINIANTFIDENKIGINYFGSNLMFDSDAGFIDYANNDYHLRSDSILIDEGINNYTNDYGKEIVPTTDLDGNPRPVGASTDIGPYEYQ